MRSDTEGQPFGYEYHNTKPAHTAAYLWEPVFKELDRIQWWGADTRRVFDLGCGNGSLVSMLAKRGFIPSGADPSEEGIRFARQQNGDLDLRVGSADDGLANSFGQFPALVSLEVVEHVFFPRRYSKCVFDLLEPGGTAIISTPYHGYWKNLAISLMGRWDSHISPLWDYGHIKFWSPRTLGTLLAEAGLVVERTIRVGRVPQFAKSMILVVRKPVQ